MQVDARFLATYFPIVPSSLNKRCLGSVFNVNHSKRWLWIIFYVLSFELLIFEMARTYFPKKFMIIFFTNTSSISFYKKLWNKIKMYLWPVLLLKTVTIPTKPIYIHRISIPRMYTNWLIMNQNLLSLILGVPFAACSLNKI